MKQEEFFSIKLWNRGFCLEKSPAGNILYVVTGDCAVRTKEKNVPLKQSDVFLLNEREEAVVELSAGALAAQISLNSYRLRELFGVPRFRFTMEGSDPSGAWYQGLKEAVQGLLLAYAGGGSQKLLREMGEYYRLLQLLSEHFLLEESQETSDTATMQQLLDALWESGEGHVSLQDVADRLHLSAAAASRLFRKATGENFTHYKRRVRLERVREELVSSRRSVTAIAMEAGFTSSTVFNQAFKEAFGVTPSQYRKSMGQPGEDPHAQDMQQVFDILDREKHRREQTPLPRERIVASVREGVLWNGWPNRVLNVGPAHLLQGASLQAQVSMLVNHLDIEYLRLWSLFSQQSMMGENTTGQFHFSFLDTVLDFCVDRHLKLHLDLAQRRDFSLASERIAIYTRETSWQQNWFQVTEAFLHHIRRRYTEQVVRQWVFEISFYLNEPYVSGAMTDLEMWKRGYALIKSVIPGARVAGPGIISSSRTGETEDMIGKFLTCGCSPDIFTSLLYPYDYEGSLEDQRIYQKSMTKVNNRNFLWEQVALIRRILKNNDFAGEYWVTEWGFSLANRNYMQDSCYRGAFILDNVLRACQGVDSLGVFCASDILSAYGDSSSVLSGSAGILSQTGIRKPAYYAYRFLQSLGRQKVSQTEHCIVTREERSDVRVLCYNCKALGPKYYLLEENAYRPNELDGLFVDAKPLDLEIVIRDLEPRPGPYFMRQRILNEKRGSPLNKWVSLGCTTTPSRGDLEFLERTSIPDVTLEQVFPEKGELCLHLTLEPNELRLITIN